MIFLREMHFGNEILSYQNRAELLVTRITIMGVVIQMKANFLK